MQFFQKFRKHIIIGLSALILIGLGIFLYIDIFVKAPGESILIPDRFAEKFQEAVIPKPRAYFRIEFPEKDYHQFTSDCNISFEYPMYSKVVPVDGQPCWFNISSPEYGAKLHLTYNPIDNLQRLEANEYDFISKQIASGEANHVETTVIYDEDRQVYGLIYDLVGNTATSLTFFVSDSVSSLRGSLYFYTIPNYDSLAPAINFFREDVVHLINTLSWE